MDEAPEAIILPNRTPYEPCASRSEERGKLLCEELYSGGRYFKIEQVSDL